jgi:hypothetical protein
MPELENPFRVSLKGAMSNVMVRVSAPTKIATGEILVAIRSVKVRANIAMVIYASNDIFPPDENESVGHYFFTILIFRGKEGYSWSFRDQK